VVDRGIQMTRLFSSKRHDKKTPLAENSHKQNESVTEMQCGDYAVAMYVRYSGWLGGVTVRASDLRSGSRGFDSRPGRYQAT